MELITILRDLWRRRTLVLVTAVIAITVGLVFAFRISLFPPKLESRQYSVGLASAQLLIDTPDSVVADLSPIGADALSARSSLLANVIASDSVRAAIARDAGLPADRVAILTPSATASPSGTLLSTRAAQLTNGPSAYVVNVRTDPTLPIIAIATQAPTPHAAAILAGTATAELRRYINAVATSQNIPPKRRFVVTTLGAANAAQATRGPRLIVAFVISILTFVFGCALILIVAGVARAWRQAAALEEEELAASVADPLDDEITTLDDDAEKVTAGSKRVRNRGDRDVQVASAAGSPELSS